MIGGWAEPEQICMEPPTSVARPRRAEAVVTRDELEGGAIYALGAGLRAAVEGQGAATLTVDPKPDSSLQTLRRSLHDPLALVQ